jgi:peptidoglycan/xylan/chitin deacetylase (PgdA/CDA1 family)
MPSRFLAILFLLGSCLALAGQSLAITLDDAPNLAAAPRLDGLERNQRLRSAFTARGVRVVIFVNGIRGGDTAAGRQCLEAWGAAGHRIGNHTYSHLDLDEAGPERFAADTERLDRTLRDLPGYWPLLRYPYLHEGRTPAQHRETAERLAAMGYRGAPVSVATYDWVYNERLQRLLEADPDADLRPLRALYLQHLARALAGYRDLARKLLGRDPAYTILMHDNLLNALFMPEVLAMLAANGWTVVAPETAYADPLYAEDVSAAGYSESILGALARKRGVLSREVRALEAQMVQERSLITEYVP